ncbi:transcriptional regulator [Paenibacillus albidus]|uniref:Transcriptional regulator n=2 Tax=Paenibacillus albidus TaxID=2041023 RepID=A0A917BZ19_9BACL|nr:transcriptional regulator [Paenibacillus albidus]
MPANFLEDIHTISQLSDSWLALGDLPNRTGAPVGCVEGIAMLDGLPDAEFIFLLLNSTVPLSTLIHALEGGKKSLPNLGLEESARYLVCHLATVRKQIITTLEIYERDYFREEWEYIEPWLQDAAARFQETVSRFPEQALNSLHPRLSAKERIVTAQKAVTYSFPYEQLQQIYVFPSSFIYPHLLISWSGDILHLPLAVDIPGLAYNEGPPADLLRQFKALSDDTRLRILKLLWTAPHCTKQIAPVLGISEAAVSKHLKQLSESGLARSERRGNYLFYSGNKEALESLIVLQRQFLEQ